MPDAAQLVGRGDIEQVTLFSGKSLTASGKNPIGKDLPLGQGWYDAMLVFDITYTETTATGYVMGNYQLINNILLKTDKGEVLVNAGARELVEFAAAYSNASFTTSGTPNGNATDTIYVPIRFADFNMNVPEDTILDTSRYGQLQLDITLGSVADMFSTVGDAALTSVTCDLVVTRTNDVLPKEAKPISWVQYESEQPQDPNSQTYIDILRETNMSLKRLLIGTTNTAIAGRTFSGNGDSAVIDTLDLTDQTGFIINGVKPRYIRERWNTQHLGKPVSSGFNVVDFVADKAITSALWTGNLSQLRLKWTNGTVSANDQVSVMRESIRKLIY